MNLQESFALSNLSLQAGAAGKEQLQKVKQAAEIAKAVLASQEEQGLRPHTTPEQWHREWLRSKRFILLDVPLHFVACPHFVRDDSKLQGCMAAAAASVEPIIVDMNVKQIGRSTTGYFAPVIVVDGRHRHLAARMQGHERIRAWVGELAAAELELTVHADHQFGSGEMRQKISEHLEHQYPADPEKPYHNRPYIEEVYPLENYFVFSMGGKKYKQGYSADPKKRVVELTGHPKEVTQKYVGIKAAAEPVTSKRRVDAVLPIEKAMQIFGAAGSAGMGGAPSSSLSQGSGPGPSLAMKPRPATGGTTVMPTLKSKGRKKKKLRKLKSEGGYFGYKNSSDTMRQKTKGASGSDMAKQLKGSGYFGYEDASDTERQKMKAPKGSEFNDPKLRNRKYNSLPEVGGLKGAAHVAKIITRYKKALKAGYKHSADEMQAVAPPGMEHVVKGLKKHFGEGSSSPFRIAWWMHNKQKKSMAADVVPSHKQVDLHERPPRVKPPQV